MVGKTNAMVGDGGSPNIQSLSVTTNGTYTASGGVDGYSPVTVNVSGGGGGSGSLSDPVRFFDYDGTLVCSYSVADFASLNALPANPSHSGLTAQGWNWTLADAKAQVTAMGSCDIGQMYITNDGKTRVYISLVDSVRLSPYLGICPNGTVVVDWGDGTATDTLTGTSLTTVVRAQHTYATTGDYVITLTVSSGTFAICGISNNNNGSYLLTRTDTNAASQRCYQNAIKKVELGAKVSLGTYAFDYCYSLASITIPSSVTTIGTYTFRYCYSLTSITIPSGVVSIGDYMFRYCYSLASITIPSGVTDIDLYGFQYCASLASITIPSGVTHIGNYAFSYCYSLASIKIPSYVTNIGSSAFNNCYGVAEYHLLPTTPPTLASTNVFGAILSDCKIYVPLASLATYKSATNWSTYASYMVGE